MPGQGPPLRRGHAPRALLGLLAGMPAALLGGWPIHAESQLEPPGSLWLRATQDELALRQLAARLATSSDPREAARSWAAATDATARELLLLAGSRAWGEDPRLASLALLGLRSASPAAFRAAQRAGASDELDQALRDLLHLPPQPAEALIEACWRRGVFPDQDASGGLIQAFRSSALRLTERGVLPRRNLARAADALPSPRPLLLGLAGFRLPDWEIAHLIRSAAEAWDPQDRLLHQLILLDHGACAAPAALLDRIWSQVGNLAGRTTDWPPVTAALFRGLERHSPWLSGSFPGSRLLRDYPEGDLRRFLLGAAPLERTRPLLLAALQDPAEAIPVRKACAVRLIRGDGRTVAPLLVPMLAGDLPEELAEFLIIGLTPYASDELGQILSQRPVPFGGPASRPSLEHRLRRAAPQELPVLVDSVLELPPADRLGTARVAWEAGPSAETLAAFQRWTQSPDPAIQQLARRILEAAMSEADVAAFYRRRLAAEPRPALRQLLLRSVRELRSDAALEVYLGWLDSDEGRRHSESGERAFMLVPETAAEPMFRRWWALRGSLAADQVDAAASALAIQEPAAREHLYGRLPDLPASMQVVLLDRLREGATAADFERWRDGFLDSAGDPAVRRACAICLAKSQTESRAQVEQLLQFLVGKARMAVLPEGPWHDLLEALVALAPPADRGDLLRRCLELEAGLGERGLRLRAARLRGMVRSPLPEEGPVLAEELLDLLAAPGAPAAPDSSVPDPAAVRSRNPLLYLCLVALGNHGPETDAAIAQRLDAAGARLAAWDPERLWFLADQHQDRLPLSAAAARRWLERLEAPGSGLRQTVETWLDLPPRLWTDFPRVAAELQRRLQASAPLAGTAAILEAARSRWPEDRRCFDYSGWFAVAAGELDRAEAWFEESRVRSGGSEQTQREPLLGLAVVGELRDPGCGTVAAFLGRDPGAAPLLPHRLAVGLRPELARLLPPTSGQ
ncbi:MAG: hypothetical protein ISR76_10940 [Planctomycetes bacterium]|nr:hypothetical protein [Planctomycetota bacterium]